MNSKKNFIHTSILIMLFFVFGIRTAAQEVLVFKNTARNYFLKNQQMLVFEDTTNHFNSPTEVANKQFSKLNSFFFTTKNQNSTYWLKLSIIDSADFSHHWYFISYNYNADSMHFYVLKNGKQLFSKEYRFRSTTMFEKDLIHKNLTMDFSIPKNELLDVYIKIRNNKSFQYGFAFRETKEYFSTSVREYFFMGLFYGAILMITLYQMTFFFSLKDYAYLFYVLYILIQGLYLCFRDASALVFLFPNTPWLIESAYGIVMCGLSISVLLYSRFFLQLTNYKLLNYIVIVFALVRVPFLLLFPNYPIGLMWFDFSAVAISFAFSIVSLIQRQRTALLFCISFGVIIIGNLINVLWHANIISCTDDIFYSLYYAVGLESLLLAVANAYRLSTLREFALMKTVLEKKVTQNMETIKQQEQMIQEKSDELDVFLYRASHDIKGPLKSIEGLSKVGLLDSKDKDQYFIQISKTSIALQKILNALLQIAKQNRAELKFEPIHVLLLVEECFTEQLVEYPGLNEMTFKLEIPADAIILAEKYLLLSVVQNLIENAIKYRDLEKREHLLTIKFEQLEGHKILEFQDNGLGVNEESLKKLFQMFFRANTQSGEGAGLGLYIVKQNVERLKGKISVESKEKEFTSIRLEFPE